MKKWTHNFGQISGQIYQICLFLMKIESWRLFSLLQRPEFFSLFHSVQCEKKEKNASNRFHSNLLLRVHIHRYFFLCTHLGRLNTFKLLLYVTCTQNRSPCSDRKQFLVFSTFLPTRKLK